jgi:predicted DNA-binding transcriptional regulator YafY
MKDELYTVKIWISPAWSRYIGEKIWHESQRIRKLPDGSLEMTLRVAGLEEIKQWVMGMGTEARVLEPESLKEMVKAELISALSYYTESIESFREQPTRNNIADYASRTRQHRS